MKSFLMSRASLALIAAAVISTGCMTGKDSVLFVTNTSLGVNLDTKPAKADFAYSRDELIIAPTFEGNHVLPVLSSVATSASPLSIGSNHSFATGDAAVVMAKALTDTEKVDPADFGIPQFHNGGVVKTKTNPTDRRRFYFGTNTVLGIGVQWSGTNVPEAVNIGFKRKELAYVPLIEDSSKPNADGTWDVRLSSLLATANAGAHVGGPNATGMIVGQLFATGEAATALSAHPAVRRVLGKAIVPEYERAQRWADANLQAEDRTRSFIVRTQVYKGIKDLATGNNPDPVAIAWLSQLDALIAPTTYDFDLYSVAGQPGSFALSKATKGGTLPDTGFQGLADYRGLLTGSIDVLAALVTGTLTAVNIDPVTGAAGTATKKLDSLRSPLFELNETLERFDKAWQGNPTIEKASLYFVTGRNP